MKARHITEKLRHRLLRLKALKIVAKSFTERKVTQKRERESLNCVKERERKKCLGERERYERTEEKFENFRNKKEKRCLCDGENESKRETFVHVRERESASSYSVDGA